MAHNLSPSTAAMRPTWPSLPREARDTVFLLVVVAWVLLPLAASLPIWATALAYTLLLWRGVLAVRQKPLPGR